MILLIVLGAVLVGVFQGPDRVENRAASARNLMQWGIALNLFLIEHQNYFPEVGGHEMDPEANLAWYNALPLYIGMEPLGERESPPRPRRGYRSVWLDPSVDPAAFEQTGEPVLFTYGMNRWLQPDPDRDPHRIFRLDNPGAVVFMTEVLGTDPGVTVEGVDYRHGEDAEPQANVLFTDGHVRLVNRAALRMEADHPEADVDPEAIWWSPFPDAPAPD